MPTKLFTMSEAATLVGRSRSTLRVRVWQKKIKTAKRIGNVILISESELKKHYPEAFKQ